MARLQSLRESNRNGEVCVARVFQGSPRLSLPALYRWPGLECESVLKYNREKEKVSSCYVSL